MFLDLIISPIRAAVRSPLEVVRPNTAPPPANLYVEAGYTEAGYVTEA